jgi:hypothetical protein
MREDLGDHGSMLDGDHDRQGATRGALLDVDLEHSFTNARPGFQPWAGVRGLKPLPAVLRVARAQLMPVGAQGRGASPWSGEWA